MPRGRPRKTDAEKKAAGTFRKDRSQPDPTDKPLDVMPATPEYFTDFEKEFFEEECRFLFDNGVLTWNRIKRAQVAAAWWNMYMTCSRVLRESGYKIDNGKGWEQTSPEVSVLEKSTKWLQTYYSDRDKIQPKPKKQKSDFDGVL